MRLASPWLWLFPLLALAGFWRLVGLDLRELPPAEGFTMAILRLDATEIVRGTARDVHPPLYYLLLKCWQAAAGSSIAASRLLSVMTGMLGLVAMYGLFLRTQRWAGDNSRRPPSVLAAAAPVAMMAINPVHIEYDQTARMYSLGILEAAVCTWLLLAALDATRARNGYWGAYGAVAALFAYTHYFALLTLAAHALLVAGQCVVLWRRSGWKSARELAEYFLLAVAVAAVAYSPWLSVLAHQAREVHQEFWVEKLTWETGILTLIRFVLGVFETSAPARYATLAWVAVLLLAALIRPRRSTCLFALMAVVPWTAIVAVSLLTRRPIFLDRYLLFAQVGWYGLVAMFLARLPGQPERWLLTGLMVWLVLPGIYDYWYLRPQKPPPITHAATWLRDHYRPGDVVLVNSNVDVYRWEARLYDAGLERVDIRCRKSAFGTSNALDRLSIPLRDEQLLYYEQPLPDAISRIWQCDSYSPPGAEDAWERLAHQAFGDPPAFSLSLFQRKPTN